MLLGGELCEVQGDLLPALLHLSRKIKKKHAEKYALTPGPETAPYLPFP